MAGSSFADGWFAFGVRFSCGALLGLLLGLGVGLSLAPEVPRGWLALAAAMLTGLASAVWGDAFWYGLRDWLWWWP